MAATSSAMHHAAPPPAPTVPPPPPQVPPRQDLRLHIAGPPASIDEALRSVTGSEPVLVIVDEREAAAQEQLVFHARAASTYSDVTIHRSHLSPLGISALVQAARSLADQMPAARVHDLLPQIEASIRCFAVLSSVSKLRDPNPSLLQHVRSWWPTTRFLAEAGGAVHRFRPQSTTDPLGPPAAATPSVLLVAGEGDAVQDERTGRIVRGLGAASAMATQVPVHTWWGTKPIAEYCLAPLDLHGIITGHSAETRRCPWCRESTSAHPCRLCGGQTEQEATP